MVKHQRFEQKDVFPTWKYKPQIAYGSTPHSAPSKLNENYFCVLLQKPSLLFDYQN